jgi:hypothetical protein
MDLPALNNHNDKARTKIHLLPPQTKHVSFSQTSTKGYGNDAMKNRTHKPNHIHHALLLNFTQIALCSLMNPQKITTKKIINWYATVPQSRPESS